MLHIVLYNPQIPPNTGNIIRLCANTGAQLHLIHPLGFTLDDKRMRRAGLDYHEWAGVTHYNDWQYFISQHGTKRIFCSSTHAATHYSAIDYKIDDILVFGSESSGLPVEIRSNYPGITIPMRDNSRSLNLSNSVAIVLYEAWRQLRFI